MMYKACRVLSFFSLSLQYLYDLKVTPVVLEVIDRPQIFSGGKISPTAIANGNDG